VKLSLKPIVSQTFPDLRQFEVQGLPPNRRVVIGQQRDGRWRMLPISVISSSAHSRHVEWIGDFDSPDAALAAIDQAFLEDRR